MRSHSKALFAVAALFALCALVPIAQGAPGEAITSFGETGTEGGQLSSPAGLAVNQASGDVYVANAGNNRIEQFSADGTFIRAWGKDVVKDGGPGDIPPTPVIVNEQQTVSLEGELDFGCFCFPPPTGGSFTLTFEGQTTAAIPYDATAAQVQSALESLLNINTVAVSGGPGPAAPWTVEFTDSAGFDVPQMSGDGSALLPAGTNANVSTAQNGSTTFDHPLEVCTDPTTCRSATVGAGDGELSLDPGSSPQLAIDQSDGSVYVADTQNNRVQKFSSSGAFIARFGEGELNRPRGVAVDPSTGDVYVADTNNNRVQRYDSSGAFKGEVGIPGGGSGQGEVTVPSRVAVDSLGRVYVLDFGNSRVERFDNTGAFEEIFAASQFNSPTELAVDPANDHPYIAATREGIAGIYEFEESGEWVENYAAGVDIAPGGLALPSASNRIYVSDTPEDRVMRIAFSIDPQLPLVKTLPAAVVTESSAWLGANINPLKSATGFWIEYSTNERLANSTSVPAGKNAPVGKGNKVVFANQLVKGLEPATTYYFRAVASSVGGTTEGEIGSFTTLAEEAPVRGLPDGRAWEKVSPAYKAGSHISAANNPNISLEVTSARSQAADHGEAVTFFSEGKFGGDGGPANSQYLAKRGPGGWVTEGITPRVKRAGGLQNFSYYQWFGKDLSWGVAKTGAALNPGDPEGQDAKNLYLRDNETKAYRLVSETPEPILDFRAASADGSTIVYKASEGNSITLGKLFARTPGGEVEPVGILPDGTEVEANVGNGMLLDFTTGFNPVSADGSRIYFTPLDSPQGAAFSGDAPLYLREGGTTIQVSASERSGDDPSAPRKARFLGASKDGSVVFFYSPQRLTDHSNAHSSFENATSCGLPAVGQTEFAFAKACAHLYRWDADALAGERLTDLTTADPQGSQVLGMTGMSEDGSSVYFVAHGDLAGTGDRNQARLYLWREGEGIILVADAADEGLWSPEMASPSRFRHARVSPDGRFLAFESNAQLTGYDTGDTTQVYLYDSETEELTCASCGIVSTRSKGGSWLLSSLGQQKNGSPLVASAGNNDLTTNISPDGRLVFDSADALVPEDTNGAVDVYEWQAGRLHLLSSGTSGNASRLIDASEDLDDIFFVTEQQLVRSDQDLLTDLYDARVGGVPEPDMTPPCVADECQGTPTAAPLFQTPSTETARGAAKAANKRPRCARGKVRRKGRCVKRKARKANGKGQNRKSKANSNRRAGR